MVDLSRRQAIAGGGGLLALLGAGLGVSHVLRPAENVAPTVPADRLEADGWAKIDETQTVVLETTAGPVSVEARAHTVQYEDRALLQRIRDTAVVVEYRGLTGTRRLGDVLGSQVDQSIGVFAATKIDLTPHIDELPGGLGRAEVMTPLQTQARETFEEQLHEAGLEDVRVEREGTLDVDTGQTAALWEYGATFRIESTTADVQGVGVTIPATEIEVAGYLAVWHNGRNAIVAAGAHPDENYADTITDSYEGEELTITFDLGLDPEKQRADLLSYLRAVA